MGAKRMFWVEKIEKLIWGTGGGGGSITKFCLKLTLLNFWIKLTQKGYFQTKKIKITIEFYIFKLIYNHFHNNLRLFDFLPNFPITTSEVKRCAIIT